MVERNVKRRLEMMNHLNDMKIAWDNISWVPERESGTQGRDNIVSVHISMFYRQRLLDGVIDHFAEK